MREMIDQNTAELFLDKRVRVTTDRNYNYTGILLQVTETAVIIDDRRDGRTCISLDDIKTIGEKS